MRRFLSLLAAAALAAGLVTWAAAAARDDLQRAKSATARYHSIVQATRAGYDPGPAPVCVEEPPLGVMGYHWENVPLMEDAVLDPTRPEILLYVKKPNGNWRLVGLEYYIEADQVSSRPSLFGVPFDGPFAPHHPGQEVHYDLHVWLWEDNPSGLFFPFNPTLDCP
jgi:hypothetical protein